MTLLHGDYQLDNIFFGGADERMLTVVDWQTVSSGLGMLDVASLLGGHLDSIRRREYERDILTGYHRMLIESGVHSYPFEKLWEDYRLAMLDGLLRMVISIAGGTLREEQDRAHREVIWPRYAAALLDLEVGELLA